jgi:hypothetical protein
MKRSVAIEIEQLKTKFTGYTSLFNYRLLNLCIEAEPVALLPVRIMTEEGMQNMEDVAQVAVDEKYHFIINPLYDDELQAIAKGVFGAHPEFKQEIRTWEGYDEADPAGKYLYCTMPEVDKDRRDVLNSAVDALYNKCKGDMETANAACTARIATLMADNSAEEADKVRKTREEIVEMYEKIREEMHDNKLKEIEDAYQEFLARQARRLSAEEEQEQAEGHPTSMRMGSLDE